MLLSFRRNRQLGDHNVDETIFERIDAIFIKDPNKIDAVRRAKHLFRDRSGDTRLKALDRTRFRVLISNASYVEGDTGDKPSGRFPPLRCLCLNASPRRIKYRANSDL